jgi:hypothetical protein
MPRWIVIVRGRLDERLKGALLGAGMADLGRHDAGSGEGGYAPGFAVGVDAETPEEASVKLNALLPEGYEVRSMWRASDPD